MIFSDDYVKILTEIINLGHPIVTHGGDTIRIKHNW